MSRANIGLISGIALFAVLILLPTPDGMPIAAKYVAAIAVLMAVFWMTEAIPIPATVRFQPVDATVYSLIKEKECCVDRLKSQYKADI